MNQTLFKAIVYCWCFLLFGLFLWQPCQPAMVYDGYESDDIRFGAINPDLLRKGNIFRANSKLFNPSTPEFYMVNEDYVNPTSNWLLPWFYDASGFSGLSPSSPPSNNKRDFIKKNKNPRDILRGLAVKRAGGGGQMDSDPSLFTKQANNKDNKY